MVAVDGSSLVHIGITGWWRAAVRPGARSATGARTVGSAFDLRTPCTVHVYPGWGGRRGGCEHAGGRGPVLRPVPVPATSPTGARGGWPVVPLPCPVVVVAGLLLETAGGDGSPILAGLAFPPHCLHFRFDGPEAHLRVVKVVHNGIDVRVVQPVVPRSHLFACEDGVRDAVDAGGVSTVRHPFPQVNVDMPVLRHPTDPPHLVVSLAPRLVLQPESDVEPHDAAVESLPQLLLPVEEAVPPHPDAVNVGDGSGGLRPSVPHGRGALDCSLPVVPVDVVEYTGTCRALPHYPPLRRVGIKASVCLCIMQSGHWVGGGGGGSRGIA
eukprot:Sspe_Gene.9863::Locus_3317_Transcript_1_4_Confidence_0.429_Length_2420::g.9863::m.9863